MVTSNTRIASRLFFNGKIRWLATAFYLHFKIIHTTIVVIVNKEQGNDAHKKTFTQTFDNHTPLFLDIMLDIS